MKYITAFILALMTMVPSVQAHHSFAVHFEGDRLVEVTGVVTEFRFTNPHGILLFTVTDTDGKETQWRAETNSPNVLRRRGWSRDILEAGDRVSVLGFPARNENNYMRISQVAIEGGATYSAQARAD